MKNNIPIDQSLLFECREIKCQLDPNFGYLFIYFIMNECIIYVII